MRLTALAAVVLSGPALAFAQPYTFVSTPAGEGLVLIDLSNNTVVGPVPLAGVPTGTAVGRAGRRLYAALSESNALAIVNTVTGDVRMVPVGAGPTAVAVAARRAYVANTAADTVSVVDAVHGTVSATIPVGDGPFAVVAGGHRVYVANWGGSTVSAIDTATNAVVATIPVGTFPAGLALNGATGRLYVANFLDDTVSAIDTATLSVVSTIPVVSRPRGLAVDATGQRLFVAGFDDGRVQVIETSTGAVTLDEPSGGLNPVDLMLGPHGTRLYVAHLQAAEGVAVLDGVTLASLGSVDVPAGPLGFSGLVRRRPRTLPTTAWPSATRALAASLSAVAAITTRDRARRSPSLSGDVVISDADFNVADWAVSGMAEYENTQEATGGNPGTWRRTRHFALNSPSETVHRFVGAGGQYHPWTQGAVATLDVSWDRRMLSETLTTEGFLVQQGNVVYRTTGRTFVSPAWQNDSRIGLVADSFDDGNGGHPDFTGASGPLRFGYFRRTPAGSNATHGIDNFVVTVHPSVVSGPGTVRFATTFLSLKERDTPFITVQRQGGITGAVSVDVLIERPDGSTETDTVSWSDGDSFDTRLLLLFLDLPEGSGARTARLTLLNPTGGAVLDPNRTEMVILVIPDQWGPELEALYIRLQGLLGDFSPAWLMVLALPASALAIRRARTRRTA